MTNTPDQSSKNLVGVPHPTPARRVVVYAVKNGWMLDVDFSQDQCRVPQWVYTSLDCLASDVKSFLHDGTAYEGPLPAPLLDWQHVVTIKERDAAIEERDAAIKERDESNEVRSRLVAYADDLARESSDLRHKLATEKAKMKILVDSQEAALKAARDVAYAIGYDAGGRYGFFHKS